MKWGKLPCPILLVVYGTVDFFHYPTPFGERVAEFRGGKRLFVSAVMNDTLKPAAFDDPILHDLLPPCLL